MAPKQESSDRVLVRTYVGDKLEDVVQAYWQDAAELAEAGYEPVGQVYVEGQWHFSEVIASVVLVLILIGWILVIRLLATRPTGSLVVTYVLRD